MRNKLRRPLAFLLSAVMIVTMSGTPVHAVADRGQPETGLCEHHTAHTDDCGYTEETPGTPCGHEHTEDCYTEVTECVHEHTPECYPEETEDSVSDNEATPANEEEREPENCPHICDGESGCITEKLDCRHEHKVNGGEADREGGLGRDSECGYTESTPGTPCTYVCEICNPQDSGEADEEPETGIIKQEQCSCLTLCTEGQINPDCLVCGAENADLSDCKGKAEKEDTKQPEGTGICKHHQEHDDACGYQPESEDSEGSPCTYECRICPIEDLIAALPDKVTEDNAEDVRAQLDEILALFSVLTEDEQEQIDLSRCYELQGALDGANDPDPAEGHAAQQEGDEASVTIDTETLYYATLEEAFAAANGKTATITMLENAECVKNDSAGSPLNITSGNVTLNMNGKTLSGIGYGSYGIVNINGGSLSVQGNGLIEVRTYGISSRGGTLAVTETSFNLTGRNSSVANSGVLNKGGTVIINSGTFSGASSVGQIHHDSGNTTINHAEMTGTTADNPVGVCYFEKGTLTINGGTFSNITVDESKGDLVKVKSVAELLGKGCAFKHQNGTWATDKEMAGKTLDNVTVQKIPLTVNPQGDTSWYYNSSPHTLAMNAAPVDSGVISYVWKNGTDTLDCTTDNYEIPADTPAGSYTYTCEATCDGYTLSHKFLFEIKQSGTQFTGDGEVKTYNGDTQTTTFTADDTITVKATPTATGEAPAKAAACLRGDPTAGQMVVFVGDTQVSAPADVGEDGAYTMTVSAADVLAAAGGPGTGITLTAKFVGNNNMADAAGTVNVNISAVAKVEKYGSTTYVGALADAFTEGNSGATVTLLSEVDLGSNYIGIRGSSTFTLDLNGQTVKAADYGAFNILGGSLTIQDSGTGGKIESSNITIKVNSGTLSIKSGTVSGYCGVEISGGTVAISGDAVISGGDTGLRVTDAGKATLSGGTFSGTAAITANNYGSVTLKNLLAEGYAYHRNNLPVTKAEGWVDSNTWGEVSLDTKATLTGTVTVKKCNHTGEGVCEYTPNEGAETHAMTCLACGLEGAAESCAYSDDYGHDETNHWQTCTLCGGKKTEAHGWVHQYTSATDIICRSCDKCEIETVVGTVSITPDFSVTYGKTGSATLVCTAELADGYSLEPADSADNCWVLMALSDGKSWNLGRELEVKLPADLPAGEYWYDAYPRLSYQGNNTIVKRFNVIGKVTVTPAPLTVTGAAAKDRTYDGTNSVQITGVTLDGVLNSDNVSVDLTGLTGTLSGSDAETYTSVTLPRLTLTGGAASNYTLPQSMGAVPASVTISKATLTATGATVASKTYDGNTAASVSSVTFTGLVPGEALALGTDYTATGTFADANAGANKRATIVVELKSSAKANNYTLLKASSVNATGTITKASSSITTAPSATGITYGQALSDSTLTGGTGSVPGAFAWTDSTAKPNAGTAQFEVTFTPTDTNYNSTTTNVSVTVAKATPTLTAPTATAIQYGQKLTDSALTGGTATNPNGSAAIAGSWHWASGNTQPTATGTFPVSFAPSDTANYNTPANVDTSVTVNPAAPKISLTVPAYQVAGEDVIVTCMVENPHDATFKEGIPENITLTYQIGSGTPQTITNGKFSIPAGTKKDTVITVTASTDAVNGKYTAATKTATVTVTDKIPVEISGISVTGRVYNGQPVNYTGTPVVKKLDGTVVTDALVSYTWSSVTAPVNAGDYSLVVAVGGGKYIGSTTIPVVIEQAEIRVTAPSKTIYVGETAPVFSAADCNITGLVQGENLKTPPTVAYAEAPDTSKTGSVTVTASGAEVPEGGNYKDRIVYENGTLTITSKPLPPAKYTITVQAGTGGTASASPTSAEKGTKITLNATPDGGYHFKEWQVISGGVTISNNSFTMPAANVTVKAVFEKDSDPPQATRYSVTVQAGTGGTASASLSSAEEGTKITLTAKPSTDYHFKGWQVISGGVTISNNSFTMPAANVTVKAVFEKDGSTPPQPTRYSVTVQAGTGGTASASPTSAEKGTKITLTATPDSGYHFKGWQVISGGVTISNNSFTMPDTNVTVKAVFEKDSDPPQATGYSVTVQAGTGGTASASLSSAEEGTKITLTAKPSTDYHFKGWQVISGGVTISNNSFTMPAANVTVKAVFEKDGSTPPQPTRYSVTVQAGTGGTASASPASAEKGTKITLTATPDSGYHFKGWQVISGGVTISNNSFTMPDTNVTVKAVFVKNSNGGGNSGGSGSGGGSSSGGNGSSSGDNGSSGGGSTIVARPDETKPDTPTTSQTKPATPDKNGNVALDNGTVQSAINAAKNDAKKNGNTANGVAVVIPVTPKEGQNSFNVTINAQTLNTLVREKVKRLEINIEGVVVGGMDTKLLKWLDTLSANGDVIFRVKKTDPSGLSKEAKAAIGTRPVYDLSLVYLSGGKETPITDFDGHTIAVRMPYAPAKDEKTGNLYAVYVDGKGKVEWLTKSSYDPDLGTVVFEAGHFSIYGIGYKNPAPDFTDIKNHWAEDNIIFVASRGLLTGTGNNQFSPNMGMTRGMFVTALGRLAGIDPDSYKTGKFTDVKADAYYAPYVNWAAEKGIVNGTTATTFSPDTNITREQMAVIMANYAKKLGYDLPAAHEAVTFADNAQISGWAAKEVKAMQQAGIMAGKGGNRFDPKGTATRAEVATVLRRFVEIAIDPQTAQGWVQNHSGSWQYMKNGKPATGWLQDDKKWYWLDSNGWMFTGGWKQIDGKWYYFYSDGSMAVNTTIDGYAIGSDGARK